MIACCSSKAGDAQADAFPEQSKCTIGSCQTVRQRAGDSAAIEMIQVGETRQPKQKENKVEPELKISERDS